MVKSCSNCHYRQGKFIRLATCTRSGYPCTTERKYPADYPRGCGYNFEGWVQRIYWYENFMNFIKDISNVIFNRKD